MAPLKVTAAMVCAGLLCCGAVAGTASAAPAQPERDAPVLLVNGNADARPGQLVDIALQGVGPHAGGRKGVTASSRALRGPVRLTWHRDKYSSGYDAVAALPMTDRPGWYPLTVAVGGRTVGRDVIRVVPSRRPSFRLSASDARFARPGERLGIDFDDLYPGESGTAFTVTSPALPRPVRLTHDRSTDFYNPRAFSVRPLLPPGLKDGTYPFVLAGPRGRITERRLTVRAARPGDPDYLGKARGPEFFGEPGSPGDGTRPVDRVPAGGSVEVWWHDVYPDAGEDERLVATSPAFTAPVRLVHDESKGADGDDPRYIGTARVHSGLAPGRYPVTVVAHHGRVHRTRFLTVTRGAATRTAPDANRPAPAAMGLGTGGLVIGAAGVGVAVRRRRATRSRSA